MLKIRNIEKSFGSKQVLRGITTEITRGEIVGLLGPNGAGKSTLMRIMTGYYFPNAGDVTIDGESVFGHPRVKSHIGYLPEVNPLYEDMGVDEFLATTAELKGVPWNESTLSDILAMTGLREKRLSLIHTLSKGYRQRVGLASALVGDPDILILDEPTEGLDPGQRDEIKTLIRHLGTKKTILISSHVLSELSDLVNRVIIIADGSIKLDDTLANIEKTRGGNLVIRAQYKGELDLEGIRTAFPSITSIKAQNGKLEIHATEDIRQALNIHLLQHVEVFEFFSEKANLVDVFFEAVKQDNR